MIVLGLNCVFHESSAALVVDGRLLAAAEEERFNRVKHAKAAAVDNAHVLPTASIDYCLAEAGVTASQIDAVSYSFDPALRRAQFRVDPLSSTGDWGSRSGEDTFLASLDTVPDAIRQLLDTDVPVTWLRHHLAHAASVYYTSCPDEAAVLVADGIGENAATVMFAGAGGELRVLHETGYPHSIGFLWEKLSAFLGFSPYDASKVMGLAGFGDPARYGSAFADFVHIDGPRYTIDTDILRFRLPSTEPLAERLGPPRAAGEPIEQRHADIAATLQELTNRAMLNLVRDLHARQPVDDLGLAGGVALNCTTNHLVKEQGPFTWVHIPSAPHDGGTAIGGALLLAAASRPRSGRQCSVYTGPAYGDDAGMAALATTGMPVERPDDLLAEVTDLLCSGAVVGWFQGRMEFGPRALGNRSLLADPRDAGMRDTLNHKVKHREHFRPFAPSVLAEHAADWFELGRPSPAFEAMLFAPPIRPGLAARIPAVSHVDGTARIQLVHREANPRFHELISRFHVRTGVPMVLNTSFNDSEPIVCSPADAVRTFLATRIDVLVLGDLLVRRPAVPTSASNVDQLAADPTPAGV